jgi:hypothetical protein
MKGFTLNFVSRYLSHFRFSYLKIQNNHFITSEMDSFIKNTKYPFSAEQLNELRNWPLS